MKEHTEWAEGLVAYDRERTLFIELTLSDLVLSDASSISQELEKKYPGLNQRNWFCSEASDALATFSDEYLRYKNLAITEIFGGLSYERGQVFVQDTDAYGRPKYSSGIDIEGESYSDAIGHYEERIIAIQSEQKGRQEVQPLHRLYANENDIQSNALHYFGVSDDQVQKIIKSLLNL